eukprot:m.18080 g.18080  ORF g.18080 m.18080 type:complete len:808 (+) comp11828_c0_seq1:105-2528(+)
MSAPTALRSGRNQGSSVSRGGSNQSTSSSRKNDDKPTVGKPASGRGQSTPYFSDNKRSEVNELRTTLNTLEVQRDVKKYREACQKVISYMTLGIDVSRLFTEMIMASASQDLVQKKLVYLYLSNYAESHSELTLLAINTLQKNCRDHNPMVRGLALRSMCALRVENLVEYVLQPLQDGLRDKSPYVRKTAVMGCVKLFYTSEQIIHECNIPDTLYSMLKDPDHLVVANCVIALEEILANEGGIVLTREIAHRLLTGLHDFNEWCQSVIMGILVRYVPTDEDEVFDILNILESRLRHSNSGVILAAARLFLHLTRNMSDMHEDIYQRLKVPLITQMASGSSELCFMCLSHLELLLSKDANLLESEYQSFYCRFNEPNYVKFKKINILVTLSAPSNIEAIVEEFAAYITDVDADLARRSLKAIGDIAIRHESFAEHIMGMLLLFLDLDTSYVTAGTLIVLQDVLRKYPYLSDTITSRVGPIAATLDKIDEPEARTALLWIIGEFGEDIEDAPYILEDMAEKMENETSSAVKVQLLTSAMKLFFSRPPEVQKVLGLLLEKTIDEEGDMDVHDRALVYYRLLRTNIDEARRVVASTKNVIEDFDDNREGVLDAVFDEFNSLSAIYQEPSTQFVEQRSPYNTVGSTRPRAHALTDDEPDAVQPVAQTVNATPTPNLLDGDMFTIGIPVTQGMSLVADPAITPAEFEKRWTTTETSAVTKEILSKLPSTSDFEQMMAKASIKTLATQPPQNGIIKFYQYAQEAGNGNYHLLEVVVDVTTRFLTASFKSDDADSAGDFAVHFRSALAGSVEPML